MPDGYTTPTWCPYRGDITVMLKSISESPTGCNPPPKRERFKLLSPQETVCRYNHLVARFFPLMDESEITELAYLQNDLLEYAIEAKQWHEYLKKKAAKRW